MNIFKHQPFKTMPIAYKLVKIMLCAILLCSGVASSAPVIANTTTPINGFDISIDNIEIKYFQALNFPKQYQGSLNSKLNGVIWESDNEEVVEVDSLTSTFTTKQPGKAILTAKYGNSSSLKASVAIDVVDNVIAINYKTENIWNIIDHYSDHYSYFNPPIYFRDEITFFTRFSTDMKDKSIILTSSDQKVGYRYYADEIGTATITATSKADPTISASITLTVNYPKILYVSTENGELLLKKGDAQIVSAYVGPSNADRRLTWSSSDEKVATIDENLVVTAVGKGKAVITATSVADPSKKASITVYVDYIPIKKIYIEPNYLSLPHGDSESLKVRVEPENADRDITWESSDENIVKVDDTGKVTAVGKGFAKITARSIDDPNVIGTLAVAVGDAAVKNISINESTLSLVLGKTKKITATITPDTAYQEVTWRSENTNVAIVDLAGYVRAVGVGQTNIIATSFSDPKKSALITVTVTYPDVDYVYTMSSELLLTRAETRKVQVGIYPYTADQRVTWKSSDENIVKVDDKGNVTAVGKGKAEITATSVADTNKNARIKVYVDCIPIKKVHIEPNYLTLPNGHTGNLTATVVPGNADQRVTWKSSDDNIVKVDDTGKVTSVGNNGTAIITATSIEDPSMTATSTVTVNTDDMTMIAVNPKNVSIGKGKTEKINLTIRDEVDYPAVIWRSSNTAVATVDATGNVTTIGAGTALITATTIFKLEEDNQFEYRAQALVTVTNDSNTNNSNNNNSNSNNNNSNSNNSNSNSSSSNTYSGGGGGGGFFFPASLNENLSKAYINGAEENSLLTEKKSDNLVEVTINGNFLQKEINQKAKGTPVTVRVETTKNEEALRLLVDGETLKALQNQKALLEISTKNEIYQLPAHHINLKQLEKQLGSDADLTNLIISMNISPSTSNILDTLQQLTKKTNATVMVQPKRFSVTSEVNGKAYPIQTTDTFEYLTKKIPTSLTTSALYTAVRIDENGKWTHLPTKRITEQNQAYILMQGIELTGDYAVLQNKKEFADITNHWAQTYVNESGARLIVEGVGENRFEPDRNVTRAEFATNVIRGLGLPSKTNTQPFTDVKQTDWFGPYVQTAAAYQLIQGYQDGSFRPNQSITREEAMVMLARAIRLIQYDTKVTQNQSVLETFGDYPTISPWALADAQLNLNAQTVQGDDNKRIRPKDAISRAETSTIIIRLLQNAKLIANE